MARHAYLLVSALLLLTLGCTSNSDDGASAGEERMADPESARRLVQAQQALESGALNVALALTDSVLRAEPELADAYFLRGRIFTALQRVDLAEEAYRKTLDLDSVYQGAWMNLGNAAFRKGEYSDAIEHYRKEAAARPSPRAWVAIGSTYEQQRQPDSAKAAYERALSLDSTYASAYMHLGQLFKSTGELARAVAVSTRGLQLDPDNVDYRYALGALLVLAGRPEEAVSHLDAVLEARPWHYWATYNLGRAYGQMGRGDRSREYMDRAQQLQENLGEIEYWQDLAQSNPDQFMLWVKLADALRRGGRESEAEAAGRVAASIAPRYMVHQLDDSAAAAAHQSAGAALVAGNASEAAERYRSFLQQSAAHPDMWLNLGVTYAAAGNVDAAREAWETALEHDPESRGARTLLVQSQQPYVPGGHSGGAPPPP